MEPVVSSKYGNRPLLEVPAMQVNSEARLEVSSLQPQPKPDLGLTPAQIYRSDGLNQQHPQSGLKVNPQPAAAIPVGFPLAPAMPGSLFTSPPGMLPYQQSQYVQVPIINIPPMRLQAPPHQYLDPSGGMVSASSAYPAQVSQIYPGVHNPYQGQVCYTSGIVPAPGIVPSHLQFPQHIHPHNSNEDFHLEGVLECGQLTTVHFRDKTSNFRGLPDFLRQELLKTYGKFPVTDIRIVARNGEFHIYATPRNDGNESLEGGYTGTDSRMIGFNEIRGDARF